MPQRSGPHVVNRSQPSTASSNPYSYNPGFSPIGVNGAKDAPQSANFLSPFDQQGNLLPQFQLTQNTPSVVDPRALNTIRERALGSGLTDWGQLMMQQQQAGQQNALNQADQGARTQTAEALNSMAQFGGYDAGTAERVAGQSARDLNASRQNIYNQGAAQRLGIYQSSQDERNNLLQALPGLQNADAQLKTYNIDNAIKGLTGINMYNADLYKTAMSGWGAMQSSVAQKDAAEHSGSSWLCTEARKTLDLKPEQVSLLGKFRKFAFKKDWETTYFYVFQCDKLVAKMKESGDNWKKVNEDFVSNIVSFLEKGLFEAAFQYYLDHTAFLITKYWSDCTDPVYLNYLAERKVS